MNVEAFVSISLGLRRYALGCFFLEDNMKELLNYFTKEEKILWSTSVMMILISFILFDRVNYHTLCASLIGVTSLIYNAKGNPIGQVLMVIFSIIYGIISYSFTYYGEMLTYVFMTLPMSVIALISWLKHPYQGNKAEVQVDQLNQKDWMLMWVLTLVVTAIFYFILKYFNTANLVPSTLSISTTFLAVYLTYKRSPYYAIAYAANDIVLIVLWILASLSDIKYIGVVVCFIAFFVNDIYGYLNWKKMEERQNKKS